MCTLIPNILNQAIYKHIGHCIISEHRGCQGPEGSLASHGDSFLCYGIKVKQENSVYNPISGNRFIPYKLL